MIVFKKDSFGKWPTRSELFENTCFWRKKLSLVNMLTIVNEGSSLTIVNETTNFKKTVVFKKLLFLKKKNYVQLYRMSSYMMVKKELGLNAPTLIFCPIVKTLLRDRSSTIYSSHMLSIKMINDKIIWFESLKLWTSR